MIFVISWIEETRIQGIRLTRIFCSLYQLCICRKAFVKRINIRRHPSRRANHTESHSVIPPRIASPDPCRPDSIDRRRRLVYGCRFARVRERSRLPALPAKMSIISTNYLEIRSICDQSNFAVRERKNLTSLSLSARLYYYLPSLLNK